VQGGRIIQPPQRARKLSSPPTSRNPMPPAKLLAGACGDGLRHSSLATK
jgi:hypothetical protein